MAIKDANKQYIKFDTAVQVLKYEVLKRIAEKEFDGTLDKEKLNIAKEIVDDLKPNVRCCIYKERAIVEERMKLALGGHENRENMIEVIDIACDECPVNRFIVTDACRGCLAKKCRDSCNFGAISFDNRKCKIDYEKCKECGKCKEVCPYNAIAEVKRPCMRACIPKALSYDVDSKKAVIDDSKCIQCGACVVDCPFGAIMDKSYLVDVIRLLKDEKEVFAIVAPAISSQFNHSKIGKVITAIKKLGFEDVFEAALGADLVAVHECNEFKEKGELDFMTTSCCPAFVSYIEKNYPELKECISNTVSPMVAMARLIKSQNKDVKTVFIGPCIAKKTEAKRNEVSGDVDYVLTFEELLALLDSRNIKIDECEESDTKHGSFYGRLFARSGGVTESVKHLIDSEGIKVDFRPIIGDGIKDCDIKLRLAKLKRAQGNFLEGMACKGGCINGPGSLNHDIKNSKEVDKYGELSSSEKIKDTLADIKFEDLNLSKNE
ncbi:4Fe-4S dicluster domain-containing protein [Clostridium perfringens]|uniref:4Fe-4S dicluster domain-containing protein n=1 Tax=Clostridium perfringens TaxID=1502 RepID=UPI000DF0EA6E|nr:4Fe-4S dicluster domain-containing protein [Clostridium perfringens]STB44146.1 [Fe] hydrogenase [Clostridium perfringens]